jgi:hypothetical protein
MEREKRVQVEVDRIIAVVEGELIAVWFAKASSESLQISSSQIAEVISNASRIAFAPQLQSKAKF